MNILKKIFYFYINSSIHVALAVCTFAMITAIEFDFENSIALMCFIFFGTITGYSFIKYVALFAFSQSKVRSNHTLFKGFIVLLALVTILILFQLTISVQLITFVLGLLTLLYAIPFLKNKSLRNFNSLKTFIVALVWAGVTVLIPFLNEFNEITDDLMVSFIQRFLMVLVLILPFEIRDLSVDPSYLRTLPQRVGIIQTKGIGVMLIGICFLLAFFKNNLHLTVLYTFGITLLLLFLFLIFAQKKQSKYYASFWVESIPIVWWVLILIFEKFI